MSTMKDLMSAAQGVALTSEEKTRILARIRKSARVDIPLSVYSWHDVLPFLGRLRLVPVLTSVLLCFTAVGGTMSYAAESALPGDLLYAVKIRFTEPLRERLSFGNPNKRARVAMRHARRRFIEAESLLALERFEDADANGVSANIAVHSKIIEDSIKKLSESGENEKANALREEFLSTVGAHRTILRDIATRNKTHRREVAILLEPMGRWRGKADEHPEISEGIDTEGSVPSLAFHVDTSDAVGPHTETVAQDSAPFRKAKLKMLVLEQRKDALKREVLARRGNEGVSRKDTLRKILDTETGIMEVRSALDEGDLPAVNRIDRQSMEHLEEASALLELEPVFTEAREMEQELHRRKKIEILLQKVSKNLAALKESLVHVEGGLLPESTVDAERLRAWEKLYREAQSALADDHLDEAQSRTENLMKVLKDVLRKNNHFLRFLPEADDD